MKKLLTKKIDGVTGYTVLLYNNLTVGVIIGVDPVLDAGLSGAIVVENGNYYWID